MLSFVTLLVVFPAVKPALESMPYRQAMPILISMLAIGVVQYYVLRCARVQLIKNPES